MNVYIYKLRVELSMVRHMYVLQEKPSTSAYESPPSSSCVREREEGVRKNREFLMNFITVPFTLPTSSSPSKLQTQNVRELVCAVKFCKRIVPSSSFVHSRKCFMKTISVEQQQQFFVGTKCWKEEVAGLWYEIFEIFHIHSDSK